MRRLATGSLLGVLLAAGCGAALAPDRARLTAIDRELGSLFLVGFRGNEVAENPDLAPLFCELRVGGVLLLARNIVDLPQPEPPMVTRMSPGATASERPSSARTPLG